jgi:hypothetical protein
MKLNSLVRVILSGTVGDDITRFQHTKERDQLFKPRLNDLVRLPFSPSDTSWTCLHAAASSRSKVGVKPEHGTLLHLWSIAETLQFCTRLTTMVKVTSFADKKFQKTEKTSLKKSKASSFAKKEQEHKKVARSENPFDKFANSRKKHEVLNRRVKGEDRDVGRAKNKVSLRHAYPGLSISLVLLHSSQAVRDREQRLIDQFKKVKKSNLFIDK